MTALSPAERVRRHRRRQRLGLDVIRVELDRWQLVDWLIQRGRLADEDSDCAEKVDAAFARVVNEMIRDKKL